MAVLESPAKMATPDAGIGTSGGKLGGEGGGGSVGGGTFAEGQGSPEYTGW